MTPRVRPAVAADAGELARLRHALYAEDGRAPEPLDAYAERFRSFVLDALESYTWRIWVAEDEGHIVGAIWLQLVERVPRPGESRGELPIGYLTNVFVEPGHRNEGLGSRMLAEVVTFARERGVEEMIVWPSERSHPFYGRAGFERLNDPLVLPLAADRSRRDGD